MAPLFILIASAVAHFWNFGFPASIVFDEVYFGRFVADYWHGTYFFDVHPPLSRLLIAAFGKLTGIDQIPTEWLAVGGDLSPAMTALRFLPALAGTLLPVVIYFICRNFKLSKVSSVAAALLICFESSLLVHSRFIMQESMLILFGFLAILFYQKYKIDGKKIWFALSAVFIACSISSKWIGLSYLAVIIVLEAWDQMHKHGAAHRIRRSMVELIKVGSIYLAFIAVIYSGSFALHFALLPRTGSGDGFMTPGFQKTLAGNRYENDQRLSTPNFFEKLIEINKQLYLSQKSITTAHPSGTKWYTWPIMQRGVYLWHNNDWSARDEKNELYLLGNPLIYWLGTLSIVFLMGYALWLASKRLRGRDPAVADPDKKALLLFLLFGYLMNLLPYSFIGRTLFLYHYETALVFSIMAIAAILEYLCPAEKRAKAAVLLVMAAFLVFLYFSPLTYGTPIASKELDKRMWLSTWR